jgi:integrase/recombinase XerC
MTPFFILIQFENYLKTEKRFSDNTCVAYKNDLNQFIEFAELTSQDELNEINYQIIRSWIVHLIDLGSSHRTVNRKLSTLRTFYRWCLKQGFGLNNPTLKIKGPKPEKRLPVFLKQSELNIEKLTPLFSDDFEGVRDRLMVELFYQTGIRLSELIALKEEDVSKNAIKVLGKRNKERIIPISIELSNQISDYQKYKLINGIQSFNLLTLLNGKNLYPKLVYRKINYYLGLVSSISKKSPHVLRHTFATHMLNNGSGLETLKNILGHASLSATQVYTHSSFTQLNSIYSQAHPRGHKK